MSVKRLSDGHPLVKELREVGPRIIEAAAGKGGGNFAHVKGIKCEFSATVLVPKAFMEEYRARFSDDRGPLAYVLAHEVAHVLAKHTLGVTGSADGDVRRPVPADRKLLTSTQLTIGKDDPIIALELALLPDSLNDEQKANALRHQQFEHEADLLAAHLLAEAGYDPQDAVRGLEFVADLEDKYKKSGQVGKGGPANEYVRLDAPTYAQA
ncbi:hypothetical protein GPECTOR_5000g1303 [Gonium pectorale]|uniref:Peptidase M48 domain-containing protein n=1 Tax=Gonium pectorale TaxID=33097 RepID=A0A150H4L7_GONPE|nr:hypothetical protein GPECTOR_5000g1303 [Gonium pectorale]|eukprot:KXZ57076.1 hypothetical protein GPECTOR_5000g1303 [Gonium pectorale]